jgi:hypothetical protein
MQGRHPNNWDLKLESLRPTARDGNREKIRELSQLGDGQSSQTPIDSAHSRQIIATAFKADQGTNREAMPEKVRFF